MKYLWGLLIPLLSGCWAAPEYLGGKTTLEPHFIRAGLRESNVEVAIPIKVQPRLTSGWRSIYEVRADIKLTKSLNDPSVALPNGILLSVRGRW